MINLRKIIQVRGIKLLNIIGLIISFIGTIVMVFDVILSKPNPGSITFGELDNTGKKAIKNKKLTIWGLSLIGIGFVLQLIAAILALKKG